MEFDLSKENIQPLRGGRNASQLEVALQAQTNEDFQRELLHQKEKFEHAIRNYDGDDPLENWYQYIFWVEQSYPKNGHEGNLVQLLEDCLAKFENDKLYTNDFRFCKLWIKYNDLQQNPLELYHMMHARGLCRGCADLYRAWAYYHEAAGDYRSADVVFQLGKRELAQPYEELTMAHQSMVFAAGQQLISGVDQQRLMEQRQALTTLRAYRSGRVGSVRTASSSGAGVLPSAASASRPNAVIQVFEDKGETIRGAEAAPVSILSVAKRQVAPKENTIKPGAWTAAGPQWKGSSSRGPKFTVHEDDTDPEPQGLRLPAEYYPVTHEDFSHWKPTLCYAEPDDPSRLPMYPKAKVYSSNETEFSIEEIRACRYLPRSNNSRLNVSHIETEQAIQSILGDSSNSFVKQKVQHEFSQGDGQFYPGDPNMQNIYQQAGCDPNNTLYQHELRQQQQQQQHHQHQQQMIYQSGGDDYHQQMVSGGHYSPHMQQNIMPQPIQYINNSHHHNSHQQHAQQALQHQHNLHQHQQSLHQQSLHQQSLHQQSLHQQSLHEQSLHQQNLHQQSLHQQSLHQQSLHQQSLHQQSQQNLMHQPMQYMNSSQHVHNPRQQHYENASQVYQENHSFQHPQQQQQQQQHQHQNISQHHSGMQHGNSSMHQIHKQQPRIFGQNMPESMMASFHSTSMTQHSQPNKNPENDSVLGEMSNDINVLWRSSSNDDSMNESVYQPKKPALSKFTIYEESNLQEGLPSKGSAMKTMPFKVLSDAELAETGSRGGHDIAAAAQPTDGAKRTEIFEDDSSSSFSEAGAPKSARFPELNATCNTQVFNFNLNAMKVSTPQSKQVRPEDELGSSNDDAIEMTRKQLFSEGESEKKHIMSTIFEETTKSSGSSSSSSSTTLKSATFSHSKRDAMAAISEEQHNSYQDNLAQNMKANAALRTSLLLEFMDCESGQSSPVSETPITPLEQAPSNPFKPALLRQLLDRIGFPGRYSECYVKIDTNPRIILRKDVTHIGHDPYLIEKSLGKGTYGQVFKAIDTRTNQAVALKLQKPPNCWEYYICKELQSRLAKHPLKESFMDVRTGYFNNQVSVFVSDFSPCGSLLDVANNFKLKAGHTMKQGPCVYLCIEMLKIISAMHQVKIIHADIKPDNFLVYVIGDTLQLQLIDFGCSIDMTFFPPGTTFRRCVTTKDFICCEMQDGRPWSYHTDLFCVAATAHVLLFDKYMQMQKKGDQWCITQRFTRYMRVDLWDTFFSSLLNQQKGPADCEKLISFLTTAFSSFGNDIHTDMRKLINIINNR